MLSVRKQNGVITVLYAKHLASDRVLPCLQLSGQ